MTMPIKDTTAQPSYFQAVKEFINLRWAAWRDYKEGYNEFAHFTTAQMRACIGHLENQTAWKRMNGNPNYLMHIYIGKLRQLGALKRFGHGKYMIVAPIPEWFGSFHFAGLQGKYDDGSCYYWNDLPANHKRNPWANITEFHDTSTHIDIDDTVELRYYSETVTRIHEVTYLDDEYRVIHTYNGDDVYDEHWRVDNYVDSEITNTEIAEHLINWVKENCNQPTTLTDTTMKKKQSTKHEETLEKVNKLTRIDQMLATISSMEEELEALKSKGADNDDDRFPYKFTEEVFLDIIRTTITLTKEEMLRSIRDGEVRIDQDAAVTLSIDSSNSIDIELEYDAIADYIDEEIDNNEIWDTVTEQLADQFDITIDEDYISMPC